MALDAASLDVEIDAGDGKPGETWKGEGKQDDISTKSTLEKRGSNHKKRQRLDVPMRAFAGGYYPNLMRMYDYLGVQFAPQSFMFWFEKLGAVADSTDGVDEPNANVDAAGEPYFIHASNNHTLPRPPPVRPSTRQNLSPLLPALALVHWLFRLAAVGLAYAYFSLLAYLIRPHVTESLSAYLSRTRVPRFFVDDYLLPLMAAVSTCDHDAVLCGPATDVLGYKRATTGKAHYTVVGADGVAGVGGVQRLLSRGAEVRLEAMVESVESIPGVEGQEAEQVLVRWTEKGESQAREFDAVVLAISPDAVAHIYAPLRATMAAIPTVKVNSVVHRPRKPKLVSVQQPKPGITLNSKPDKEQRLSLLPKRSLDHQQGYKAGNLHLRSTRNGRTEAIHAFANDVLVTTQPIVPIPDQHGDKDSENEDESGVVLSRARFTRVLRTVHSRAVLNRIFGENVDEEEGEQDGVGDANGRGIVKEWRNGDGQVWLAGGWCWDGIVLLEGCVVSAMRVAEGLGVGVPW